MSARKEKPYIGRIGIRRQSKRVRVCFGILVADNAFTSLAVSRLVLARKPSSVMVEAVTHIRTCCLIPEVPKSGHSLVPRRRERTTDRLAAVLRHCQTLSRSTNRIQSRAYHWGTVASSRSLFSVAPHRPRLLRHTALTSTRARP